MSSSNLLPEHRVRYSAAPTRSARRWPGDARVAVWVALNIEHYEFVPPPSPRRNPWTRVPHPDIQQYSYRDYGNRVGLWRILRVLDGTEVRPTVSLNLSVLDKYPQIRKAIAERSHWSVMIHGDYNTRYFYDLSPHEELQFYLDARQKVLEQTGIRVMGALSPGISASPQTPDILAQAGFLYHAEWLHDDEPTLLKVSSGQLVSLPYSADLNDATLFAVTNAHFTLDYYIAAVKRQFDCLYREGAARGKVLCLPIHTYLMGQPHAVGAFAEILDYMASHESVWFATADDIVNAYISKWAPHDNN